MSRFTVAIICAFLCTGCFIADCAAITLDEIGLMLRSGVSSQAIMKKELTRGPVYGTFDAERAEEFKTIASPALIEALKSGKYAASEAEELARQKAIEQQAAWQQRVEAAQQAIDEKAQQAAEQRTAAHEPRTAKIVVADAKTGPDVRTPSEIAAEAKAASQAKIAAREKYCQEHPAECETLLAIQSASGAPERARGEAQRAQRDLRSLKTSLWLQGANSHP